MEAEVLPALATGRLQVPVAATFDMEDAPAGPTRRFAAGSKLGKVVLEVGGPPTLTTPWLPGSSRRVRRGAEGWPGDVMLEVNDTATEP